MQNKKFKKLIRKVNVYPPYLGMAIRLRSYAEDFTRFEVELRSRWYNLNLFGTHFGGCLYSMCDPFYVFILTMNLGKNYIVWDNRDPMTATRGPTDTSNHPTTTTSLTTGSPVSESSSHRSISTGSNNL